jgi:hypothetical protein
MSVLLTRLTDPETNSMRVTVFCSVRLLTRLVCSPTPMCTHQFLSNLPAKRRELPWTSNGQVQCWQNAPAVCLAFVPALREYFAAHARPDGGTPMYMLQSLLRQLDAGFDRASSAAASSSAAKALFDRARGICVEFPLLFVVVVVCCMLFLCCLLIPCLSFVHRRRWCLASHRVRHAVGPVPLDRRVLEPHPGQGVGVAED